jgi:hypothetical protein
MILNPGNNTKTVCGKICDSKQGVSNHKRWHSRQNASASKKRKKPRNDNETQVSTLKLIVTVDAYEAMTARVGERGRKKKEIRIADQKTMWIEKRLDGRVYDSVKLYGAGYISERVRWTEFECLGYRRAGREGGEYTVGGMCDGEEWEMFVDGVVWEICLGKVLARHYVQGEDDGYGGTGSDNESPPTPTKRHKGRSTSKLPPTPPPYSKEGGRDEGTASAGFASPDIMKSITDLVVQAQQKPMELLGDMLKLQQAQTEAAVSEAKATRVQGIQRSYNMSELKDLKSLF